VNDFDCHLLFNSLPLEIIVLAPPEYIILAVTDLYLQTTNNKREIVGKRISEITHKSEHIKFSLDQVMLNKKSHTTKIDDSKHRAICNSPIFDNGEIKCIISQSQDVVEDRNEIHTSQENLRVAHEELDNATKELASKVAQDTNERKEFENKQKEFRFLAESMPQKVFTTNPLGEIIYVNYPSHKGRGLLH
jgi:hypothetical protein